MTGRWAIFLFIVVLASMLAVEMVEVRNKHGVWSVSPVYRCIKSLVFCYRGAEAEVKDAPSVNVKAQIPVAVRDWLVVVQDFGAFVSDGYCQLLEFVLA